MPAGIVNGHGLVGKFVLPAPVAKDRVGRVPEVLGYTVTVTLVEELPGFETFERLVKVDEIRLPGRVHKRLRHVLV